MENGLFSFFNQKTVCVKRAIFVMLLNIFKMQYEAK